MNVVVVGAGLSGLCCARRLHRAGVAVTVAEAADAVGGRVRTDRVDGFRLDRGFQVLLTAYPECREVLDYDALDLRPLAPGAMIRADGRFCRLTDPWRVPSRALESLLSPAATFGDKVRMARLRRRLSRRDLETIFGSDEVATLDYLRDEGFSEKILERFFRPFLGGVFLESELATTSRMFEFVFKMFADGDVAVPNLGMQAIPEQIAAGLPPDSIRTGCRVESVDAGTVTLESDERIEASCVVIATDGGEAQRLSGGEAQPGWSGTTCLYYDAPEPPVAEPVLMLNGEGGGPINSVTVMSEVAEGYAPTGRALISVSVVGLDEGGTGAISAEVRRQLGNWFGPQTAEWRLLRSYEIPQALPAQPPGVLQPAARPVRLRDGVYACGDHLEQGSIQGAMVSGRRAAEAILREIRG